MISTAKERSSHHNRLLHRGRSPPVRAAIERDDRRAARHRLDHHKAKLLGPVDREQQRPGGREKFELLRFVDPADEFDMRLRQQRLDYLPKVRFVGLVHLRGDLQREPRVGGNLDGEVDTLDGEVDTLFRADPAEERQICRLRLRLRCEQIVREATMTVPSQFAFGTGTRCEFEIDTTGACGNMSNTGANSGRSRRPCSMVTKGT